MEDETKVPSQVEVVVHSNECDASAATGRAPVRHCDSTRSNTENAENTEDAEDVEDAGDVEDVPDARQPGAAYLDCLLKGEQFCR